RLAHLARRDDAPHHPRQRDPDRERALRLLPRAAPRGFGQRRGRADPVKICLALEQKMNYNKELSVQHEVRPPETSRRPNPDCTRTNRDFHTPDAELRSQLSD